MNPLAGILSEAWRMYKAHAWHLIVIALVIYVVAAIIIALLWLAGGIGVLLGEVVVLFAGFLVEAALVKAVQDVRDGRVDLSVGETVSVAIPSIWPLAVASILASIAIMVGLFLLIVPGLFLITIWAVFIPVIVIERSGALASFGRSQEIVRGSGWHVFGTIALVWILYLLANIVLWLIFAVLPTGIDGGLGSVIAGALITPFIALTVTLIYYRLTGQDPEAGVQPGGYGVV